MFSNEQKKLFESLVNSRSFFTNPARSLSITSDSILFRDEMIYSLSVGIRSIISGFDRKILLHGYAGSGKSFMLEKTSILAGELEDDCLAVLFFRYGDFSRPSDFFYDVCMRLTGVDPSSFDDAMDIMESFMKREMKAIFFIDDIDLMFANWNANKSLEERFFRMFSIAGISVIATAITFVDEIPWNDTIIIEKLHHDAICAILKDLFERNVSEGVYDQMAIEICVSHVEDYYGSDLNVAIDMMEECIKMREREFFKNRDRCRLTMADVQDIAKEYHRTMKGISYRSNKKKISLLLALQKVGEARSSVIKNLTYMMMDEFFPNDEKPSMSSIRFYLRELVSAGIVEKRRVHQGQSKGSFMAWRMVAKGRLSVDMIIEDIWQRSDDVFKRYKATVKRR